VKLKSPLIIMAEIHRLDVAIKDLHEKMKDMGCDSPAHGLYQMNLHEHMIRKSTLEWVIK